MQCRLEVTFAKQKLKSCRIWKETRHVLSLWNLIYNWRIGGEIAPASQVHLHNCFPETQNSSKQFAVTR